MTFDKCKREFNCKNAVNNKCPLEKPDECKWFVPTYYRPHDLRSKYWKGHIRSGWDV